MAPSASPLNTATAREYASPAEAAHVALTAILADLDRLDRQHSVESAGVELAGFEPAGLADAAIRSAAIRGVCVDAPPGAGKSTLAVAATRHLTEADRPVMIVTQTNEQADDLVDRLAGDCPGLSIGRLHKSGYLAPPRVTRHAGITLGEDAQSLESCQAIVSTAAKWAYAKPIAPRWAIVDEVYQMRSDALLLLGNRFERALFVGDPGQLDPFSAYETDQWAGSDFNPLDNAMDVTLRNNPGLPVHTLPVSWRLPPSAVPLVSQAFYPNGPFEAGTRPEQRSLVFGADDSGDRAADEALDRAAQTGWSYLELPHRHTLRTDEQVAEQIARVAVGLLRRGAVAVSERSPSGGPVTAERIAIGTAHRDQRQAVKRQLRRLGGAPTEAITVDTANTLQGREFDVTIAWHPLSGRADASRFHLETGRLCVLLSRHRHACIVVGRAGIQEVLDANPGDHEARLGVPPKFPDGWFAHQSVLAHLRSSSHHVPVTS
ncbi:MAG TPA: AAA domain-containing protein [Actinocrinis sp.]|jgi:hypothetical protein